MGRTSDARDRLLEAAIDLIWSSSYGAVGVDAICERAGVKKGSFYHFFASKDDLVVAALDLQFERRRAVLDEVFSPTRPPVERLRRYLELAYQRQLAVREERGRVLGCFHNAVGAECIQQPPEVAAKVQEVIAYYRRYIETALRDAKAEGLVRTEDPVTDAKVLFAFVQGALLQARIHDDPELLRDLPRTGLALLGVDVDASKTSKPRPRSSSRRKDARL